jgi:hypothetical protein
MKTFVMLTVKNFQNFGFEKTLNEPLNILLNVVITWFIYF